jgi:hypothetical protein
MLDFQDVFEKISDELGVILEIFKVVKVHPWKFIGFSILHELLEFPHGLDKLSALTIKV